MGWAKPNPMCDLERHITMLCVCLSSMLRWLTNETVFGYGFQLIRWLRYFCASHKFNWSTGCVCVCVLFQRTATVGIWSACFAFCILNFVSFRSMCFMWCDTWHFSLLSLFFVIVVGFRFFVFILFTFLPSEQQQQAHWHYFSLS